MTENTQNILEEDPDIQEIPLEIQGDDDKTLSERDSYDELAKDAEVATEPPKRGRGRPLGSKNKKKAPEPEAAPVYDGPEGQGLQQYLLRPPPGGRLRKKSRQQNVRRQDQRK